MSYKVGQKIVTIKKEGEENGKEGTVKKVYDDNSLGVELKGEPEGYLKTLQPSEVQPAKSMFSFTGFNGGKKTRRRKKGGNDSWGIFKDSDRQIIASRVNKDEVAKFDTPNKRDAAVNMINIHDELDKAKKARDTIESLSNELTSAQQCLQKLVDTNDAITKCKRNVIQGGKSNRTKRGGKKIHRKTNKRKTNKRRSRK
jgi:hypothetical protein